MERRKKIEDVVLALLDGSPTSLTAAKLAVHIARMWGQKINGLFVIKIPKDQNTSPDLSINVSDSLPVFQLSQRMAPWEEIGDQALQWLQMECFWLGVPVTTEIVFGEVAEVVHAKAEEFTLLTMGRFENEFQTIRMHSGNIFAPFFH